MDIQKLYDIISDKRQATPMSKLSIYDLNKVYSHLATLPANTPTKLLNLLHVTSKNYELEATDEGLCVNQKVTIPGLSLSPSGEVQVVNQPTPGFAHKASHMPLRDLLTFVNMQHEYTPSLWLSTQGPSYESPEHSNVAPFVLIAFKKFKGMPFNAWDKEDKHIRRLLPKSLVDLPNYAGVRPFGEGEIRKIMELMFYTNKQKQAVKPSGYAVLSLNTAIPRAIEMGIRQEGIELSDAEIAYQAIPASLSRMFLQSWVYNAKHRTSDLILDADDWSAVPDDIWEGFIGFATLGKYRATNNNLVFGDGELV